MNKNVILAGSALLAAAASGAAGAFEDERAGLTFRLDNKFSAGAAWRVESRDPALIGIGNGGTAFSTNGDDGNLNWDAGEVVSTALKLTSDLTISRGDWGVFVRGSYLFNDELQNRQLFDAADYGPGKEAPLSELEQKTHLVQDFVGDDADLLDAYLYGGFDVGSQSVALRLGRQVINWGESTFVLHGINSILALDGNHARVPGFELDEVYIPTNNLWVSFGVASWLNFEAFYQLDWQNTYIDASGTYWSTNDFAGVGGTRANLGFGRVNENSPASTPCFPPFPATPTGALCLLTSNGSTVPRAPDVEPDDDGQWGVKVSTIIGFLNDMDLSFYAMNYHSRLPVFSGTSRPTFGSPSTSASYFVEYPEDIQLYGLSFNTTVGDWSLQGEYSMKVDQPLQVDDVELLLTGLGIPSQISPTLGASLGGKYLRGWRRHDVSQYDLGVTRVLGPLPWLGYDQLTIIGEAAYIHVHDLPAEADLRYEGPGTYTPGNAATAALSGLPTQVDGYATRESYGYNVAARAQYNNVFEVLTVEPTLRWIHDLKGITPTPITNFVDDRRQFGASVSVRYLQSLEGVLGYTRYFGAGRQNLLLDRDFMEAVLRYSF